MSDVYVARVGNDRGAAMGRVLGWLDPPRDARSVAVKLNLCDYRKPETGAVSDPVVVDALLGALRERYPRADLVLCENDASDTLVRHMWGYLGLDRVAAQHGARCVDLPDDDWVTVSIAGLRATRIEVPRLLLECDLLVNHPKLKTHGKTKLTCALKNMFGCYRPKDKGPFHRFLDEAIVDINLALRRPHIVVADADLCVEGNRGPTQGFPKRLGWFIGSRDPVALDAFAARVMGFRPGAIGHVRKSARAGLGTLDVTVHGDLAGAPLGSYRFQWSRSKFLLMQVARRLVAWSAAG
jgi:uncharacterized protein (DUF362 family)